MFENGLGHYLTYHHVSQSFFRTRQEKFDGLIIPLSVATVFKQGTGGFVLTLKKPYAIDPRTPLFQADFDRSSIRQAHMEMADIHGPMVMQVFPERPLVPADFKKSNFQEVAGLVLQFQKQFAETSNQKVEKYAKLLGEKVSKTYEPPEFLIPPYFRARSREDPWYSVSLELARAGAKFKGNDRLTPVVHISQDFPEEEFEAVAADYLDAAFDGVIVFINNLKECEVPTEVLTNYARFVEALAVGNRPLMGLFGGYFTLLLRKIGLGCFSNAVGYGEYRDSGYHEGGQAVRRYYVPKLHRYFTDIEAQSLLDIVNQRWFKCACPVCAGRRSITEFTSQELLDHFLNTRYSELEDARQSALADLLDRLGETVERLSKQRGIPLDRYEHLSRWVEALRQFA
jgi:hypothetical protein